MIRTILIEDEEKARETLANMLGLYCPTVKIIDQAQNVEEGIRTIEYNNPPSKHRWMEQHGFCTCPKVAQSKYRHRANP